VSLEAELIVWLRENLPTSPRLVVGLGDDAAVVRTFAGKDTVITTDLLSDGVDFLLHEVDPLHAGHKALGVNLSDLAAMAAQPVAAFVSLALPRGGVNDLSALELARQLYRGMFPLAEKYGMVIAGGDTNTFDGPLTISITAVGDTTSRGPLTRSGAQVGDQLFVTGDLGGSILGRHLQVEPRVNEALELHEQLELHAGIDISDGLAIDASRMAHASGCGVALELSAIPISQAACQLSERDGRTPLDHALGDGEDFELLLAVPKEAGEQLQRLSLGVPITRIGKVVAEPGLWSVDNTGELKPLESYGYQHRADT